MKLIKPSYEILTPIVGDELKRIELAARTCYKSEDKITETSAEQLVRGLIRSNHEAMLEHGYLTVKFICDRGVSHELVRHRLFSFAQESTRYCNYSKDNFDNELTFIEPIFFPDPSYDLVPGVRAHVYEPKRSLFISSCNLAEMIYLKLLDRGAKPEEARAVLPNSLKTEIVVSGNYREWRHFFYLRAADITGPAHPQMKELTVPLLRELNEKIPVIFEDIVELVNKINEPRKENN